MATEYSGFTRLGTEGPALDRITMAAAEQQYPPAPFVFPSGIQMLVIQAITTTVTVKFAAGSTDYFTLAPGQSMGIPACDMGQNVIFVEGAGAGACEFLYDFSSD